jgi:4-hydroxy-3-polyprenylbenzoate decarboxylase
VETHLVLSRWARSTIELETDYPIAAVRALADEVHGADEQGSAIASGSFPMDAMVIVPCSMKTLAGIRSGYADTLVLRAADVTLKERRPLVLVPRETPLSQIHLDNMLALARQGVTLVPPMPAFYNHPRTIDDIVNHLVARILDQLGLRAETSNGWSGMVDAYDRRAAKLPKTDSADPAES